MNWRLVISREAEKFISKNNLDIKEVEELVRGALCYFKGEEVNVDIKKLKGSWKGFYRIRVGKTRVIVDFDFAKSIASLVGSDPTKLYSIYLIDGLV